MAKVISNLVDVVKYNELARLQLLLKNLIAHSDQNGFLGVATVEDFISVISPYVAIAGSANYVPVTGAVLPDLTGRDTAFTFLTRNTYSQARGGDLVIENPLVTASWSGTTNSWSYTNTIDLSGIFAGKLDASEFDAMFGINTMNTSLFSARNQIWSYAAAPPKGALITVANRANIGYQPVQPNTRYTLVGVTAFVAFFNAAGNAIGYISAVDDPGLAAAGIPRTFPNYDATNKTSYFRTPAGTAFITANDGSVPLLDTDAAYNIWKGSAKLISLDPTKATTLAQIEASKVDRSEYQTLFANSEVNILNKALVKPLGQIWNYGTNPPTGGFIASTNRSNIGYQPVQANTEYVLRGVTAFVAFFNAAGNVIKYNSVADDAEMAAAGIPRGVSNYNPATQTAIFTTPTGAAFITANDGGNPTLDSTTKYNAWVNSITLTKNQKIDPARLPSPEDYLPYPSIKTADENVVLYSGKRIQLANRGGAYMKKLFSITGGNQQGLAYARNRIYVSFDVGSGNTRIEVWDFTFKSLLKTITVATGHGAELAYNPNNQMLYVANGGYDDTVKIFAININAATPSIQRTYNLSALGNAAMVAVDPDGDKLWITSSPVGGDGTIVFTCVDIPTGNIVTAAGFTHPYLGVPNGMVLNNGMIHFSYGTVSTSIAVFDVATKTRVNTVTLPNTAEPEGLDVVNDELHPYYVLGLRDLGVHAIYLL